MGKKRSGRFVLTSAFLFVLAVICVLLFYTCSLEYEANKPVEIPVEIIPEIVVEPAVEEPVVVEEPIVEEVVTEPVVEEVVEDIIPEPVEEVQPVEEEPMLPPEAPDLDWYADSYISSSSSSWEKYIYGEEIDWSKFVFSDQELVLPDGIYYVKLYVNDSPYGSVEFEQIDAQPYFKKTDLEYELTGTLSEDYFNIFFQETSELYGLEYLETYAEKVVYNSSDLTLKLYFNSSQVPMQTLSVGSSSYSLLRQNYEVIGNTTVEPAAFSLQSNISAYVNAQFNRSAMTALNASVSFANTFSFWNMTFNLPISLSFSSYSGVVPSIGTLSGYMDFPSQNLRLSFGNVGNSGFKNGSPFGFTLERNYGYGTGNAMGNQYAQTITIADDSTITIKINGNVVYTKTLTLGEYRLTDFAFVQGSNDIEVLIHPVSMGDDTSADQVLHFSQNYDTSLLAKGESTWRFGASIPKVNQQKGTGVENQFGFVVPGVPRFGSTGVTLMENSFNFSAFSVFWDQTVGITHEYTQSHSFSFVYERTTFGQYSATFGSTVSGTLATKLGTTRATLNGILDSSSPSRNSLSINLSQSFVNEALKPLSLSGSYQLTPDTQTLSLSTGYSWSIATTRISLSLNSSYKFSNPGSPSIAKPLTVNGALSMSTNFGKGISFSLSSNINQDLVFYASASLSLSLGSNQSINTSASSNNGQEPSANIGWFYRPTGGSRSSYQVNISNIYFSNFMNTHVLSAAWSRSGELSSMSFRAQASNNYKSFSTSFSLSTALAFADGEFAMTNSLYGPFFIISPVGNLKNSSISVTSVAESGMKESKKTFGNVLYSKLSMYKGNNVVVYASNGSLFSSAGTFLFKVTPVARQGFLVKVKLDTSVAVSGVLRRNENLVYDSYSSPIYKVTLKENSTEVETIEIDNSSYFFTDMDGRYIVSDLSSGLYMFDLEVNGEWYAAFFEVPESDQTGLIALFKDYDASYLYGQAVTEKYDIFSYDDSYAGSVFIEMDDFIGEEEYWDMLFSMEDDYWDDYEDEDYWEIIDQDYDLSEYQTITNSAL